MELPESGCRYYNNTNFNEHFVAGKGLFSTLHVNARSVKNKTDELNTFLNSLNVKFDAIIFTESWLTKMDPAPYFEGYKSITLCRENKRGGGIAIYLKTEQQHQTIEELTNINENVESMFVRVSNVVIGAIYRPPDGNVSQFIAFVENALYFLESLSLKFTILGDINIDVLSDTRSAKEFMNTIHTHACSNIVTLPTRITSTTATLLDVCVTNIENDHRAGIIASDLSDHLPIFCIWPSATKKCSRKTTNCLLRRQITDESLNHFVSLLEQQSWNDILNDSKPNTAYQTFSKRIKECYDAAFPLQQCKSAHKRIRKPWVTLSLFKRIKEKDCKYHNFIQKRDPTLLAEYKIYRNKLNSDLRKAKCDFCQNKFARIHGDHRKMWAAVNQLLNRKSADPSVTEIVINNTPIVRQELADEMNRHFINIGKYTGSTVTVDYSKQIVTQSVYYAHADYAI